MATISATTAPSQNPISTYCNNAVKIEPSITLPENVTPALNEILVGSVVIELGQGSRDEIEFKTAGTVPEAVSALPQTTIEIESVAAQEHGASTPSKTVVETESVGTLEEALSAQSQTVIEIESVGTLTEAITGPSENAISTCLELDCEMVDLDKKLSQVETPTSSVGKMRPKKRRSKSGSRKRRLSEKESNVGSGVPSSVALCGSLEKQVTFAANGVDSRVEPHVDNCLLSETPISKSSQAAVDVESMNALAGDVAVTSQTSISAGSRDEIEFKTVGTVPEAVSALPQTAIEIESVAAQEHGASTPSKTVVETESVGTLEETLSAPSQTVIEIESVGTLTEAITGPSENAISTCLELDCEMVDLDKKLSQVETPTSSVEAICALPQTMIEIESVAAQEHGASTPSKTVVETESVGTLEEALSAPSQTVIEIESVGSLPEAITGPSENAISTYLELDCEMVDLDKKLSQVETTNSSVGKMRSKKRRSKIGSQKWRLFVKESNVGSGVPSSVALHGSLEMQVTFAANGVDSRVEPHVDNCLLSETPISKSSQAAVDVESMNALAGDVAVTSQTSISAGSRDEIEFKTAGTVPEAVSALPQTTIEIESVAAQEHGASTPSKTVVETESVGTLEEALSAPSQTVIEIESIGTLPEAITRPSENAISTSLELDCEMVDLDKKLSQVETPTSSVGKMRPKKRRSKSSSQKRRLSEKESNVGSGVPSSVALSGSLEMQVTFAANGVDSRVEPHVDNCLLSETPISKSSQAAVDVEPMNALEGDVAVTSQTSISAGSRDEIEFKTAGTAPEAVSALPQTAIEIESVAAQEHGASTPSKTVVETESVGTLEEALSAPSQTVIEIESVGTLPEAITRPSENAISTSLELDCEMVDLDKKLSQVETPTSSVEAICALPQTTIEIESVASQEHGASTPSKTLVETESVGTLEQALSAPSQTVMEIESVGTLPEAITGPSENAISTCLELDCEMVDLDKKLSKVETPTSSVGNMRSKKRRSKSGSRKRRLSEKESNVGSGVPSSVALCGSLEMQVTFAANGVDSRVEPHVDNWFLSETPISKSSQAAVDVESMNAQAGNVAVTSQTSWDEIEFKTAGTVPEAVSALPQTTIEIESVAAQEHGASTPSKTVVETESVGTLEEALSAPSQTVIEIESVGSLPEAITGPSENAISTYLELDCEMVDLDKKLSQVETPTSSVGKMRSKKRRSKSGSQKWRLSVKESNVGSGVPLSVALHGSLEMQVTFAANGVDSRVEPHVDNCLLSETPISKSSQAAVDVESMNALAGDVAVTSQTSISAGSRDEIEFKTAGTVPEAVSALPQTAIEIESVAAQEHGASTPSKTVVETESVGTLEEALSAPSQTVIEIESVGALPEVLSAPSQTAIEVELAGFLPESHSEPSQKTIEIQPVCCLPESSTAPSQNVISTCLELDTESVDLGTKVLEVETSVSSVGKIGPKRNSRSISHNSGSRKRRQSQKDSSVDLDTNLLPGTVFYSLESVPLM